MTATQTPVLSSQGVFHALPAPATLVDADGIIVDVNDAYIEYAARHGYTLAPRERVGQCVLDFARSDESRRQMVSLLKSVFSGHHWQHREGLTDGTGRRRHAQIDGCPLFAQDGLVTGGLIVREDVTEAVNRDLRRGLRADLHEEVWRLRDRQDMDRLLKVVGRGLAELGIPFDACGVNLVDPDAMHVWCHSLTGDGRWVRSDAEVGRRNIITFWQAGAIAYRQDLDVEDAHGEAEEIQRLLGHRARSVVDIPFSRGTLAVNSQRPEAFHDLDLEVLAEIAMALDDGFRRLADLEALNLRNLELEALLRERDEAQEALRASEARYRDVVESLPLAVVHCDVDGRILYRNPHHQRILGYTNDDLRQTLVTDLLVDPHARETWLPSVLDLGEHRFEVRCRHRDGRILWHRGHASAVHDADGRLLYVRSHSEDITEQRLLAAREGALHRLREEVWRMHHVDDLDRIIVTFQRCLEMLDIDVEGCSIHVVEQEDPARVISLRHRRGDTEWVRSLSDHSGSLVVDMWRKNETCYRPDLLADDRQGEHQAIVDRYGSLIRSVLDVPYLRGTIGVNSVHPNAYSPEDQRSLFVLAEVLSEGFQRLADIEQLDARDTALQRETAERRQLQMQLQQAQKMEAVGQLTAGVAHNFNNLLQVILGNLELCQVTTDETGQMTELLEQATDAGDRAAEIIRHLLVFSRQTSTQSIQVIDVRQHVEATVEICGRIFDRRIDITCHLPTAPTRILGNAADVEQVLLNLLLNARDALKETTHPRIVVDVRREHLESEQLSHPDAEPGDYICLSVADNGPGISAADQARLFEPFFTTKDVGQGTGLGLFTAYGIARQHGGWIESSVAAGKQTIFRLLLPAAQEEQATATPTVNELPRGTERILIVDDEELIRAVLSRILESLGYNVVLAQDGPSGIARYQEGLEKIDLVLLDLSMPQMSGIEVLEQIRLLNPDVRVIILTGYAAQEAARAGVPVVQKPVNASRLAQALREAIDGEPSR